MDKQIEQIEQIEQMIHKIEQVTNKVILLNGNVSTKSSRYSKNTKVKIIDNSTLNNMIGTILNVKITNEFRNPTYTYSVKIDESNTVHTFYQHQLTKLN